MAGGFRILESGDSRVSESGDSRITEELIFASCSLSAAQNNLTASGGLALEGSVSLTVDGGITTSSKVETRVSSSLSAFTSIPSSATALFISRTSISSSGSVVADPDITHPASISLSSTSSIDTSYSFVFGGLFTADPEDSYERATEDGSVRATEDSDIRIVAEVLPNAAIGVFNATYTYIAFSSTAYVKYNGEWTQFTPKVNRDGSWVDPLAIYKKQDSINWKRAY
jgi:hypothetical protein